MYGYIGLKDFTMYPLIRPGSFVQIDGNQRKIKHETWRTEFERPIYFVELRDEYVCSWCEIKEGHLIAIPHPHSSVEIRRFPYPREAEIVGRITGVAMRLCGSGDPTWAREAISVVILLTSFWNLLPHFRNQSLMAVRVLARDRLSHGNRVGSATGALMMTVTAARTALPSAAKRRTLY